MRLRAKVDRNQVEIVRELRMAGASVECIHSLGKGVPDLLVGWRGHNFLMEVKDGEAPPSKQKLTDDERTWHMTWRGQKAVVSNCFEALDVLKAAT